MELGAGTGIFSRLVLARAKEFGVARLISLEPSEGMRKGWQDSLDKKAELKAVPASIGDGLFQETGQADASADVVAVAQAWHWNYSEGPKALKEVARVLKPGGHLSLIWNLEDGDVPVSRELRRGRRNATDRSRRRPRSGSPSCARRTRSTSRARPNTAVSNASVLTLP